MNPQLEELGHARAVAENQQRLGCNLQADFDFIVCGAGSAGCVVAARLAEQLDAKVTLLEAGGVIAVWSQGPDAAFVKRFAKAGFAVEDKRVRRRRARPPEARDLARCADRKLTGAPIPWLPNGRIWTGGDNKISDRILRGLTLNRRCWGRCRWSASAPCSC